MVLSQLTGKGKHEISAELNVFAVPTDLQMHGLCTLLRLCHFEQEKLCVNMSWHMRNNVLCSYLFLYWILCTKLAASIVAYFCNFKHASLLRYTPQDFYAYNIF